MFTTFKHITGKLAAVSAGAFAFGIVAFSAAPALAQYSPIQAAAGNPIVTDVGASPFYSFGASPFYEPIYLFAVNTQDPATGQTEELTGGFVQSPFYIITGSGSFGLIPPNSDASEYIGVDTDTSGFFSDTLVFDLFSLAIGGPPYNVTALGEELVTIEALVYGPGFVPEPSTWAMLVLGFAGLGYAGYRRAKAGRATLAV